MDKTCAICFEEMDMKAYDDEHASTQTCFKLQCNHAFHTKCIVECLQKTNHNCPSCNKHKTLQEELTKEGLICQLFDEVKKEKSVRDAMQEFTNAKRELVETLKTLKEDTAKYVEERTKELKFKEKQRYVFKCLSSAKAAAIEESKQKGPMYRAVINESTSTRARIRYSFERLLIGNQNSYIMYRLKHPYMSFRV
jgi:hypothetical protein